MNDDGTNLDPHRVWARMMINEKPGGHGERSVAVVDMAVWDAVAKIEGIPLYRLLAERYRQGDADEMVVVHASGGYYYPGALSYGLVECLRTLSMLRENGWSWQRVIPHGGHQMALNVVAGLGLGGNES